MYARIRRHNGKLINKLFSGNVKGRPHTYFYVHHKINMRPIDLRNL